MFCISFNVKFGLLFGLGLFERGRGVKSSLDVVEVYDLGRFFICYVKI